MESFDYDPAPRLVFGAGVLNRLGELAREQGFRRTLLVADPGLLATPHVERAVGQLDKSGVESLVFSDFGENPDTEMVERGRAFAENEDLNSIIGLGGGSSMDCAKAINFLVTNGGSMKDYWGARKTERPLLAMFGVPTTAGTGSEAQSYALITDAETHVKMACSAPPSRFRIALLDPELTLTSPGSVTASAGFDALSHAVEVYVTKKRTALSNMFSREAFRLLVSSYRKVLDHPDDLDARSAMHLGAYYAGVAIENSMLGATHACANPLTQRYGTAHGRAIAMCLPTVVRFNAPIVESAYSELLSAAGLGTGGADASDVLASLLEELATAGGLPTRLAEDGVSESDLPELAHAASTQWTGQFNPRPFDEGAALEVYRCAY